MIERLTSKNGPAAVGPYSIATRHNDTLYLSGQIPLDPKTGDLVDGDIEAQTRRVLDNIKIVLADQGCGMEHVIKATIFLSDMGNFAKVNEIYGEYFHTDKPSRSCVAVKTLPKNVDIEIEVIAAAAN